MFPDNSHNNSGPKFGIQLFDPRRVHIITSLESVAALTLSRSLLSLSPTLADPSDDNDLLHIPTPWHNSLVEVVAAADNTVSNGSGGNTPVTAYYVAKAKVVREALSTGLVQGEWSLSTGTFRVVVPSLATEKLRHESKEPSLQLPALHPAESTTLMRPRRVSEASAMVPPLSMCGGFGAVHHARRLAVGGGSRGRTGSFASALMTRPSRLVA